MTDESWLIEGLRFTAFSPSVAQPTDWWARAVGGPPDQETAQPKQGSWEHFGDVAGRLLRLVVQPRRIDWTLLAAQPSNEGFATIGPLNEVVATFESWIKAWLMLADLPPLVRIAVGGVALEPVATLQAGYFRLAKLLPFVQILPDSSDLSYQVNRRRNSTIDGVSINRLAKWSVAAFAMGQLRMDAVPVFVAAPGREFATRVELDINTVPLEFQGEATAPLPPNSYAQLATELFLNAQDLIRRGDQAQ